MKLEETIQTLLDKHSTLFGDRKSVLVYLYCYFGTGYKWVNGELISDETQGKFKGKLNKHNIAEQKLSEEKSCIKYAYESEENQKITYDDFINKVKEIKEHFINIGMNKYKYSKKESIKMYEDNVLQPYLNIMRDIRNGYILNLDKMLNEEYSPIYNIPNDVKEDWLLGSEEVKCLFSPKMNVIKS